MQKIVDAYVEAGDFSAAISAAETMESRFGVLDALSTIARDQRDGAESARQKVATMIAASDGVGERTIANAQASLGHFEAALSTARGIQDASERARALSDVAVALAEGGEFSAALDVAEDILDAGVLGQTLLSIGRAQSEAGQILDARSTLRAASATTPPGAMGIQQIVIAQGEAGDIESAFRTIEAIADPFVHCVSLSIVARAQAEAGEIAAALATATVVDNDWRGGALGNIAVAQVKRNDFKGALDTARSIEQSYWRANALLNVAVERSKKGPTPEGTNTIVEALAAARSIAPDDGRAGILAEIAAVLE